jgi:hypothetical protein
MKESSHVRIEQLYTLGQLLWANDGPAICGGDFNMRDAEFAEVNKRGQEMVPTMHPLRDAYICLGKPKDARATWVAPNNPNVRCRFDRVFANQGHGLEFEKIELLGTKPIPFPVDMTPSDHFCLVVDFSIAETQQTESQQQNKSKEPKQSIDAKALATTEMESDGMTSSIHEPRKRARGESISELSSAPCYIKLPSPPQLSTTSFSPIPFADSGLKDSRSPSSLQSISCLKRSSCSQRPPSPSPCEWFSRFPLRTDQLSDGSDGSDDEILRASIQVSKESFRFEQPSAAESHQINAVIRQTAIPQINELRENARSGFLAAAGYERRSGDTVFAPVKGRASPSSMLSTKHCIDLT